MKRKYEKVIGSCFACPYLSDKSGKYIYRLECCRRNLAVSGGYENGQDVSNAAGWIRNWFNTCDLPEVEE